MRCVVTGAAGFIGMNLVGALVEAGHDVVAIDRVRRGPAADSARWHDVDILDSDALTRAVDGAEIVFHLAAVIALSDKDGPKAMRVNVDGARVVAEAARMAKVRRLVHCSSLAAFDPRDGGVRDERGNRSLDPALPVYHRSKALGEVEVLGAVDRGLDAVICNPTGVFGPVDFGPSRLNKILLDTARGRMPISIEADFDLVDVRDVATGLIAAGQHGRRGENYLLNGHTTGFRATAAAVARQCGRRPPLVGLSVDHLAVATTLLEPVAGLFGRDEISSGAVEALRLPAIVDGSKARLDLGYRPRPTARTIDDLIDHFVATGRLRPRANSVAAERINS